MCETIVREWSWAGPPLVASRRPALGRAQVADGVPMQALPSGGDDPAQRSVLSSRLRGVALDSVSERLGLTLGAARFLERQLEECACRAG